QSALLTYNTKNVNTAASLATHLLRSPKIKHRVDKILESIGYGEQVRLETLANIGKGQYRKKTIQTRYDADGETVKDIIITESTPGADSAIRANDVINKLTGRYESAKQAQRVLSKSYQQLIDRVTSQASQTKIKRVSAKDTATDI
ncbi:MAG: hypothetical protein ABIJ34_01680, partial [archaeon]